METNENLGLYRVCLLGKLLRLLCHVLLTDPDAL